MSEDITREDSTVDGIVPVDPQPEKDSGKKKKSIIAATEIFQRAKTRGSLPRYNAVDPLEKRDYIWIRTRRAARNSPKKKSYVDVIFYPEIEQIAKDHGFDSVFNSQPRGFEQLAKMRKK